MHAWKLKFKLREFYKPVEFLDTLVYWKQIAFEWNLVQLHVYELIYETLQFVIVACVSSILSIKLYIDMEYTGKYKHNACISLFGCDLMAQ